jgi:N-acetylglutamate synthase-like GNAT family acetyltransferase
MKELGRISLKNILTRFLYHNYLDYVSYNGDCSSMEECAVVVRKTRVRFSPFALLSETKKVKMKIRKAAFKDANKCLKLQKLDKENYWKKRDFTSALKDKNVIFLVAEQDKKIIGYIIGYTAPTKKTDVMLHETRVSKKERGKGIGTKLVKEFCRHAFKKNGKDVYAMIEPEHCKFYIKSCGFRLSHKWLEIKKSK